MSIDLPTVKHFAGLIVIDEEGPELSLSQRDALMRFAEQSVYTGHISVSFTGLHDELVLIMEDLTSFYSALPADLVYVERAARFGALYGSKYPMDQIKFMTYLQEIKPKAEKPFYQQEQWRRKSRWRR